MLRVNTVFTTIGICHTSYVDCLLARSGWNCRVPYHNKVEKWCILLGFIIGILCYVARLNNTFFHVVCEQSVIYFVFRVGGCVCGAVLNFSVSEKFTHTALLFSFNCLESDRTSEEMC